MKKEDMHNLFKLKNQKQEKIDFKKNQKEDAFNIILKNNKDIFLRKKLLEESQLSNIFLILNKILH